DMYAMTLTSNRVTVTSRLVRVYCPGGEIFDVREDLVNRVWCPARRGGYSTPRGTDRPVAMQPDSVTSNGRRGPRHMDPSQGQPKNDDRGNDKGKNPNEAKPDHSDAPKTGIGAFMKARGPQNQKQDDKDKKPASDSTDKKKP